MQAPVFPAFGLPSLAGYWRYQMFSVAVGGANPIVQLVGQDSERWTLIVWSTAGGGLMTPDLPQPAGFIGIPIPVTRPIEPMCYRDYGAVLGGAWNASNSGAPSVVNGISVSWSPRQESEQQQGE